MKTLFKLLALVLLLFTISMVSAQDKMLSFGDLPVQAQAFVKKYFSVKDVAHVTMDTEYIFKKEYEVILKDGSKMEFDSDGQWKKVEMKAGAVPPQIIPAATSQYIRKSFPNTFVKEIGRERKKYEIEISNGLDLEFSEDGKFIRVDD